MRPLPRNRKSWTSSGRSTPGSNGPGNAAGAVGLHVPAGAAAVLPHDPAGAGILGVVHQPARVEHYFAQQAIRRPAELPPAGARSQFWARRGEHSPLRARRHPRADRAGTGAGPGAAADQPVPRSVPGAVLYAVCDADRRRGLGLAVDVLAELWSAQRIARGVGVAAAALPAQSRAGLVRGDGHDRLAISRIPGGHLSGRAGGDSARLLRGGRGGRRVGLALIPAHDGASAEPHVGLLRRVRHDHLPAAVTQVLNMTFGDQGGPLASTLTM